MRYFMVVLEEEKSVVPLEVFDQTAVATVSLPKLVNARVPAESVTSRSSLAILGRVFSSVFTLLICAAMIAGLVVAGQRFGWTVPKLSTLITDANAETEGWCTEHSVAESECVECKAELLPRRKSFGWCKIHGVHECPLCHPEVAQVRPIPAVTSEDRAVADRALTVPRVENTKNCKLHQRRIQFTSVETVASLGIQVAPVARGRVTERLTANGEIVFDPDRLARLSPRTNGTVWRVEKQIGDRVKEGELLVLVEAAEVGKAKTEYSLALSQLELRTKTLATLRESAAVVAGRQIDEGQSALEEARAQLLAASQRLLTLGLAVRDSDFIGKSPSVVTQKLQFLGLPELVIAGIASQTRSSNLLAVRSPIAGEVIERKASAGEAADPAKLLFVIADPSRMWLMLDVRLEDAQRLAKGLNVRFRHSGHSEWDEGRVSWISPAADEKTRTVAVRVELENSGGRHQARTFGQAEVVIRDEPRAIVVPSEAVHWEGDCHVVFVRDLQFETEGSPKVFHTRTVKPGAKDGGQTEIIAGVLPGELVATRQSGVLRSELLKNNLGAG
jgi:membrane fusion protein, heavy metal efflux system